MRGSIKYALAATILLSAAAIWTSDPPAEVAAAIRTVGMQSGEALASRAIPRPTANRNVEPSLPSSLPILHMEPARLDIFMPVQPPMEPVPIQPAPKEEVVAVAQQPAPAAPPMPWRFLGSMVTPTGSRIVMLAHGNTLMHVEPGTRLSNGYVVEAVGPDAVRFIYPPLDTVVLLPLPASPDEPR